MFFHKNKRKSVFCTKRTAFCALFLVLLTSVITTLILNVNAQLVPVASVEITSEHLSYANNDPGSWKITKSAEWVDFGKAKITFEVNSVPKYDNSKKLDVLMVIDNSGSMSGEKLTQVKADASDLINTLLSDSDNSIALVSFNSSATIMSSFTNDKDNLLSIINTLSDGGCTNYYDGLLKAGEIMETYTHYDDRELVLLFLTDGYPNVQSPDEIAQYEVLKEAYPYMTINGIQYEMGDTILQPIIDISDNQYIADMSSLNNVLFEATVIPYAYDDFIITDYINDAYWTVAGLEALEASLGDIALENGGSTPKITWDMSGVYRSGRTETLTIEINLKSEFINQADLLLPTNIHEEIQTEMSDSPEEDVDSTETPILKDYYNVIYDANAPSGCDPSGSVPETVGYTIFSPVEISDKQLSCPGYSFKGWRFETQDIKYINDDYFRMPGHDVHLLAIWSELSISKSLDGTPHQRASAIFDKGSTVNTKMKALSGQTSNNTAITSIKMAASLPPTVNPNDSSYILSSNKSEIPIYGWFDEGTLYFYSDAEDIYLNADAYNMFNYLTGLTDISGLAYVNTSMTTTMSNMFSDTSITNIDALSGWDVSSVKSMNSMFYNAASLENINGAINWDTSSLEQVGTMFMGASNLKNIDGAINWDTSKVTSMSWMFLNATSLENIDGAINWDTSKVTTMSYMFGRTNKLDNIDGAINWDTSKVTTMSMMFQSSGVTNIDGAINWDTSKVTDMSEMFRSASNLKNTNGAINWDTSEVTTMYFLFGGASSLESVSGLANWNTVKVKNLSYAFQYNSSLLSIDALSGWNTSSVMLMSNTFAGCSKIPSLEPLTNWNTSQVTDMSSMFYSTTGLTNAHGLELWNVSSVTTMSSMFSSSKIKNVDALSNWNTINLTDMSGMFNFVESLEDITGLSNWNTSNVTNMASLFYYNVKLKNIDALRNWNVSNVTNMNSMFYYVSFTNASAPALSSWNVSNVTTMSRMFQCSKTVSNLNMLQNWNVSNVTNMSSMFQCTYGLTDISGISGWNVSNVTNMSGMFYTSSFTSASALSGWNVSNVTNMSSMFYDDDLSDLTGLENWTPTSVTNISSMFYNDTTIRDLSPLNGWVMPNLTNMTNAFKNIPTSVTRPTWYSE